jgi:hypothetical protein
MVQSAPCVRIVVASENQGRTSIQKGKVMDKKNIFSVAEFKKANEKIGVNVGYLDYLHLIFLSEEIHSDLIFSFLNLFWPKFKKTDQFIFLEDNFNSEMYSSYIGKEDCEKK